MRHHRSNTTQYGLGTDRDESWEARAACRDYDPEMWFPIGDTDYVTVEAAKAVCRGCPVIDDCYRDAVGRGEFGIWAGLTDRERRLGHKPPRSQALEPRPKSGNASKTHCPQMHLYDYANTYVDATGRRHCRQCARERVAQVRRQSAVEVGHVS
jgi:WhiB family redox-sensing transcriptional regulator